MVQWNHLTTYPRRKSIVLSSNMSLHQKPPSLAKDKRCLWDIPHCCLYIPLVAKLLTNLCSDNPLAGKPRSELHLHPPDKKLENSAFWFRFQNWPSHDPKELDRGKSFSIKLNAPKNLVFHRILQVQKISSTCMYVFIFCKKKAKKYSFCIIHMNICSNYMVSLVENEC